MVPVQFVSITWALEAILLAWLSSKKELYFLRFNYCFILVIIAFRLLMVDEIIHSAYSFPERKYYPFNLATISGLVSVVAFFYCLKKYEVTTITSELEKTKQNSIITLALWAGILLFSLLSFSREFHGLAQTLFPFSNFSQEFHLALLILFGSIMIWFFCKTQLKEQNRSKLILISCFWVVLLMISNNIFSTLSYYKKSEIIWSHLITLILLLLLSNLFLLHKQFKYLSLSKLPIIIFSTGIILSMLIIRREVYLFTYAQTDSEANYQISLSILYSLLALGIYILGLLNFFIYFVFAFGLGNLYFRFIKKTKRLYFNIIYFICIHWLKSLF